VLFLYGGGSIKKSNLYQEIVDSLEKYGINYIEVSGVEPNPKVSFVREVLAKNYEFDMILAIGGGSVIDTAKSIGVSYRTNIDPWKFNTKEVVPKKCVPIGVVLTISAAGSEMSSSCVITNEESQVKLGFNSEVVRPLFAFINPELSFSVNKYQTACGIVDIMMHTLERYINKKESMLADEFAIGLLKTVVKYGMIAYENPYDYEARKQLMLASSFSHNGITHIGRNYLLRAHIFEHIISGFYDNVTHGAGLAIVWPAYAKYIYKNPLVMPLFARLAYELFAVEKTSDIAADAYKGIIKMEEYFKLLNMPIRLEEVGITISDLERFSLAITKDKTIVIKDLIDIDYEVAKAIFSLMFSEAN
jgi:alcohol dehydrogenase YqhD (iron-dependent ADH family)